VLGSRSAARLVNRELLHNNNNNNRKPAARDRKLLLLLHEMKTRRRTGVVSASGSAADAKLTPVASGQKNRDDDINSEKSLYVKRR